MTSNSKDQSEGIVSIGEMLTRRQRERLRIGDSILDRYKILGELGQGGMGLVFQCLDEVSGIEVAVKMLPPEVSRDSGEMEEVRENFQLVSSLVHQNICAVRTLEKDSSTGEYFLIMELARGMNLRQYRKQKGGRLPVDEVTAIVRELASALDYAHARKVIHRDIKPSNVIIGPDGAVKLLDFGLAAQIHTSFSRVSHVRYGTSGTGPYMAPEQWRGQYQDGKTDQYALAVLAYELLTGHCPFESHEMTVLRESVLNEPPVFPPEISPHVAAALKRALSKERSERCESCSAFVEAMGKEPQDTQKTQKKERGRGWLAAVATGVVVLMGLGWFFANLNQQSGKSEHSPAVDTEAATNFNKSDANQPYEAQARIINEDETRRLAEKEAAMRSKQEEVEARTREISAREIALIAEREAIMDAQVRAKEEQKLLVNQTIERLAAMSVSLATNEPVSSSNMTNENAENQNYTLDDLLAELNFEQPPSSLSETSSTANLEDGLTNAVVVHPLSTGDADKKLLAQQDEVRRQAKELEGIKCFEAGVAAFEVRSWEQAVKLLEDAARLLPVRSSNIAIHQQIKANLGDAYAAIASQQIDKDPVYARRCVDAALKYAPDNRRAKSLQLKLSSMTSISGGIIVRYYVIKAGDSLNKIAVEHGVSVGELMELNKTLSTTKISVGQQILLPAHAVKR